MTLIKNQCKKNQLHLQWKLLLLWKKESLIAMTMMITHKASLNLKFNHKQLKLKYNLQKNKDFLIVMMMRIYPQQKLQLNQLKQLLQQKQLQTKISF